MMRNYFFLMIFLLATSCGQSAKKIVYENDSVKLKQDLLPGVSGPLPEAPLGEKILGIWTDGGENAAMQIKKDSIFYPDKGQSYKYTLKGDTIRIFYDKIYTYKAALSFKKDSLIMDSPEDESLTLWRFKN